MSYNKLTPKMALNLMAPHTWAPSICPSVFGCAYCLVRGYSLHFWQMILLVAASILMQSSVNCLNDYTDFVKGTDSDEDNLERNDSVLVFEKVNPKSALYLGISCISAAAILGIALILSCKSLIPLWIGLIGAAVIILYSGGKLPISYLPVGEFISGFVMGGLIPLGCVAVATGEVHPEVLLFSIPFIVSIGLVMMSNNGCDIEKDIEAGRKTLPVIIGRSASRKVYKICVIIWMLSAWMLPVLLIDWPGIACAVLMHFIARPSMLWLMDSPLDQEHRIQQMKTIVKTNYLTNGCYILTVILGIIINGFKG